MAARETARLEGIGRSHSFWSASSILINEQSLLSEEQLASASPFVYLYCAIDNVGSRIATLSEDCKQFHAGEINTSTIKWLAGKRRHMLHLSALALCRMRVQTCTEKGTCRTEIPYER